MKNIILTLVVILFFCLNALAQDDVKNSFALELGTGGGDGIHETTIYGIHYTRSISERFNFYGKYVLSNGTEYNGQFEDRYIKEGNTEDEFHTNFVQYYSFGLGLRTKIARTDKSFLFLSTGIRYLHSKQSKIISRRGQGSNPKSTISGISNLNKRGVGYELGIGYQRTFLKDYFAGGSIDFVQVESRISTSLIIGFFF